MKRKEEYNRIIMFSLALIMLAAFTMSFGLVWFRCYAGNPEVIEVPFWRRGNYVVVGLYGVLLALLLKLLGGFNMGFRRIYDSMFSQCASILCANGMTYLQLCLIGHWAFGENARPIIWMTAAEFLMVPVFAVTTRKLYVFLNPPRNTVMIYGDYSPLSMVAKIKSREDQYALRGMFHYAQDMEMIQNKIMEYGCVLLVDMPDEIRNSLVKFCFANDIRCYLVPKLSDIMIKSARDIHMFDTSLLLLHNRKLTVEQRAMKRLVDICVSFLGLLVASPIMLIIALCIKLDDGGPVFFTQERLTRDGARFRIYKFRSMRVENAPTRYRMTQKSDDRVTPVGKIIRNLHFDELPQLFNVLKGDMSIVGPRPECEEVAEQYCKIVPEFHFRLKVKAGLTGFAQVYGKYNTTPLDKLYMDLNYIENYSLRLDVKLMILTLRILFQKEKSEGVENGQDTAIPEHDSTPAGKV